MNTIEIEKKIVELAIHEKSLVEQRNDVRAVYFSTAETHPTIQYIIDTLLIKGLGIDRRSISRYSQEGKCSGMNDEEYLSDILVTIFASTPENDPGFDQCSELSLKLRITGGFDNMITREKEHSLTTEISALREEIDTLKKTKQQLKL